jgi:transketolase
MRYAWGEVMSTRYNYRKDILNQLVPYFKEDERYQLLVCDMGFGALDQLKKLFPARVTNCGIMEQGTIGIAAGMSMSGMIPIVYSIVNFLVFRSLEQIRNDIVGQNLNVKLIATGVNDYFKFLGKSHCCGNEDIKLMKLISIEVFDPYKSKSSFKNLVNKWITSGKAGYIRV